MTIVNYIPDPNNPPQLTEAQDSTSLKKKFTDEVIL
jgi:hypothetical protein